MGSNPLNAETIFLFGSIDVTIFQYLQEKSIRFYSINYIPAYKYVNIFAELIYLRFLNQSFDKQFPLSSSLTNVRQL